MELLVDSGLRQAQNREFQFKLCEDGNLLSALMECMQRPASEDRQAVDKNAVE